MTNQNEAVKRKLFLYGVKPAPEAIELLPTPSTGFSQERINSEMQDKINELVKAVNKLRDQK